MAFDFRGDPEVVLEVRAPFEGDAKLTPYSNYLIGVKWSPDGEHLLTASADKTSTDDVIKLPSAIEHQGHPIHLWDASLQTLRATYRCYDARDELVACTALGFSGDGCKVFGGIRNGVHVFDVARPGRDGAFVKTWTKSEGGVRGWVSSIGGSLAQPTMYAMGTYGGEIGIFALGSDGVQVILGGHSGGITKVMFTADGWYLFSGARMDTKICCWDLRSPMQPVYVLHRHTDRTHQRIHFDLEPIGGRHLASAQTNGVMAIYDITTGLQVTEIPISEDCLNGISFHPSKTYIATATGTTRLFLKTVANGNAVVQVVVILGS